MLALALAICLDDPGPALFRQRRVGVKRDGEQRYFSLLKFRSMKMDTPHDVPTHLLKEPESYVTRTGRFLRRYSLDELPQLFNILAGSMSFIGPRPALWNQYDLVTQREKYGANDIRPGLSGWAQINGRDTVEIDEKARLDGEYAANVSLGMDWRCFWGTLGSVLRHEGVVEGGTGRLNRETEAEDMVALSGKKK